jgi:hypothetical protein
MGLLQNDIVVGAFFSIVLVLVGFAIKALRDKIKNANILGAVDILAQTVTNTVKSLQTTLVQELQKANEDGVLTQEEKNHIKQVAIDSIKNQLAAGTKELLKYVYGDLDEVLDKWVAGALFDPPKSA